MKIYILQHLYHNFKDSLQWLPVSTLLILICVFWEERLPEQASVSLMLNHGSVKEASLPRTTGGSMDLRSFYIWDLSPLLDVELGKIIFQSVISCFVLLAVFSAFQIFSFVRSSVLIVDLGAYTISVLFRK